MKTAVKMNLPWKHIWTRLEEIGKEHDLINLLDVTLGDWRKGRKNMKQMLLQGIICEYADVNWSPVWKLFWEQNDELSLIGEECQTHIKQKVQDVIESCITALNSECFEEK